MINFNYLFAAAFFIWVCVGVIWLFPQKMRLMKRGGMSSSLELNNLADNGDIEAKQLKRKTTVFIVVGLLVLVPLRLMSQ
ncbi:hypothetical protein [Noviherbaspirillum aerium]|uniref:hypothetical protein n=1 Tax=Noviherbaspirillum aerium TaxID=2588497 RepID=UPI00124D1307|nr:hypothetical protein [Noviherbaspirillum aerium]